MILRKKETDLMIVKTEKINIFTWRKFIDITKKMDDFSNKLLNNADWDPNTAVNNLLHETNSTNQISSEIPDMWFFSGFSIETICIWIIASIIWAYYIKTGKKDGKIIALLCGIWLLGISYFIKDIWYLISICLILAIIPIFFKN